MEQRAWDVKLEKLDASWICPDYHMRPRLVCEAGGERANLW